MSLANRLSLYISLIIIVIFCAIGFLFMQDGAEREERLASLYANVIVDNSVDKLDSEISRVEYHLVNAAPLFENKIGDIVELMPMVERFVTSDSLIMGGCVALLPARDGEPKIMEYVSLDSEGRPVGKHLGSKDYDYTAMPWFTNALKADSPVWSDPYFDKGGGNKMMVTCSYPLHDSNGKTAGVLTADVSLDRLSSEIARLRPIDDSYAFIISNKGIFMSHPDSTLILKKNIFDYARETGCGHIAKIGRQMLALKKGSRHTDITGEDALVVYEPIPGTGWSICSVCSYKSIMSRLDSVTIKALVLLFLGLLLAIVLVRLVVLYAMKNLVRLTTAAAKISEGDLNVKLPDMKPSDDIGRLNNAFTEVQKSLRFQMERLVETTKAKEHIESELHIARDIQMGLVPHTFSPFAKWPNLELYAKIRPAKEVGGDLYDFFIRDSKLFFTIGDVSGKGVPASLFMAVTRTLFRNAANSCDSPAEILTVVNGTIVKDNDNCMFVTMFAGSLDLSTGYLVYCNAGHNPPVIVSGDNADMLVVNENIPVGVIDGFDYREECMILKPGEMLFLYTDGLTEAENADKNLYGDDRMLLDLSRYAACQPKEVVEKMEQSVDDFVGDVDQSDDLTMLCFRFNKACKTPVRRKFINTLDVVGELPEFIATLAKRFGLDDALCSRVNLLLEEALVNVVSYAYPEGTTGEIALSACFEDAGGKLILSISDSGKPFDPTKAEAPDLDASLEDRPIGGLGIYLVRTLADGVEYKRENDRNILTVTLLAEQESKP